MKRRIPAFLAGMLTTAILMSLVVGVFAASGLTITVDPTVKIQVNGSEFKPKDVNGKDVMTFVYNGTTYAPVRAMAEAFGLEVGYDSTKKMATVWEKAETSTTPDTTNSGDYSKWTAEEEKAYQEFKGMWDVDISEASTFGVKLVAKESIAKSDFAVWVSNNISKVVQLSTRYSDELIKEHVLVLPGIVVDSYNSITSFYYGDVYLWQQADIHPSDELATNKSTYNLEDVVKKLK